MNNTDLKVLIIGHATCPEASRLGYDGGEARANLLSTGKILCISCGTLHEGSAEQRKRATGKLLERVYDILAACGSGPVTEKGSILANNPDAHKVPEFDPKFPRKLLISPYAAACLSGYDPNTFDQVRVSFAGSNVSAEVKYFPDELERALSPDLDYDEALAAEEVEQVPVVVNEIITRLQDELGFRVRGSRLSREDTLPDQHLALSCGTKLGSMGYISGISLGLSWRAIA